MNTYRKMNGTDDKQKEIDVLGMWMVEDLMRALNFDINKVEQALVKPNATSEEPQTASRQWYERVIAMMKAEGIQQKGHLKICKDAIERLTARHKALLKDLKNKTYRDLYYEALPAIVDFRSRQQLPDNTPSEHHSEIESWLEMLYGVKLLKLQGQPISEATQQAASMVGKLYDLLRNKDEE